MNKQWTLIAAIAAALALGACKESATETAEDVAEAQQDARTEVADERAEAVDQIAAADEEVVEERAEEGAGSEEAMDAEEEAAEERVEAGYETRIAEAKGRLDVDMEKCDALSGAAKTACQDTAKAVYAAAESEAERLRDSQLAAIPRDQ